MWEGVGWGGVGWSGGGNGERRRRGRRGVTDGGVGCWGGLSERSARCGFFRRGMSFFGMWEGRCGFRVFLWLKWSCYASSRRM